MQTSKCPVCNSDLVIDDEAFEGDLVDCNNCNSTLEISSLRPLRVTLIKEDE